MIEKNEKQYLEERKKIAIEVFDGVISNLESYRNVDKFYYAKFSVDCAEFLLDVIRERDRELLEEVRRKRRIERRYKNEYNRF